MPEIGITVTNKIAQAAGKPEIVCGNSDYNISFAFDSEWSEITDKTVQLAYYKNGAFLAKEVEFTGTSVTIPALYGITEVCIGVYAGNIRTTTPARVPCLPCITDIAFSGGGGGGGSTPYDLAELYARIAAIEFRLGGLSFRKLTQEEYDALTEKDENSIYFVEVSETKIDMYAGDIKVSGSGGVTAHPVNVVRTMTGVTKTKSFVIEEE